MANKVKIKHFEVWDAETGEADIIAQLAGGKELNAFSLDIFEQNEELEAVFSVFCREFQFLSQSTGEFINNIEGKYQVELQGRITGHISGDEEGELLTVEAEGIAVNVYIPLEKDQYSPVIGGYLKCSGRLDIERPHLV